MRLLHRAGAKRLGGSSDFGASQKLVSVSHVRYGAGMIKTLESMTAYLAFSEDLAVVWLCGSQADGSARADSDFDLAVAFKEVRSGTLEARLRPEELGFDLADASGLPDSRVSD